VGRAICFTIYGYRTLASGRSSVQMQFGPPSHCRGAKQPVQNFAGPVKRLTLPVAVRVAQRDEAVRLEGVENRGGCIDRYCRTCARLRATVPVHL
jgi:hypothetical protein